MEEMIMEFILDKFLYLIPALWIIGKFLKRTPNIPDWTIPWCLLGLGVLGAISIGEVNTESILQGILTAGAAVFVNEAIKQTSKRED